ncbi:MAG: type VI secretion protein IcmF/TssM N-terminal domain-containing protein [Candidatus Binataceae bacterium]
MALAEATTIAIAWRIPWFKRPSKSRGDPEFPAGGGGSPEEFQTRFNDALRRFRALPQHAGRGDPIYSMPWYLMLGGGQSGKSTVLAASGLFSPLTPVKEGGTLNCDWWVSNRTLVLDTAGRFAFPADPARDRAEWYRLLSLIRHRRGREPLNGVIVTIAADELAVGTDEKLQADGAKIRERLEEAIQQLGRNFPLYLLLTKCDLIEGFSGFLSVLPEAVANEAVGYVDDARAADGTETDLTSVQTGLHSIYERLHFFRMSMLNGKLAEPLVRPVYCFPEEFRALEEPFARFAEPILSPDVRYHTPFFRGVFLTSARQAGVPFSILRRQLGVATAPAALEGKASRAYFVHDLFERILPRDRALGTAVPKTAA